MSVAGVVVVGSLNSLTTAVMHVDTYQMGAIGGIIVLVLLVLFLVFLLLVHRRKQQVKAPVTPPVSYTPAMRVTTDATLGGNVEVTMDQFMLCNVI